MNQTILVLGATGNIGSKIVRQLSGAGVQTRAAIRKEADREQFNLPGVVPVMFDTDRPETVSAALTGVDRLFLLVPFVESFDQIGVRLVEAAKQAGVKRLVRLSALGASDRGLNIGQWHHAVDTAAIASGLEWTILKPSFFMQNLVNYQSHSIRSTGAFYQAAGDGKAGFIDTRDIAAVAAGALLTDAHIGKTYTLTGGEALSYGDVATIISQVSGKPVSYVDVSPEAARASMEQMQMPAWQIEAMLGLMEITKKGWAATLTPSVEAALGRKPISFGQFAFDYADSWK